jgi:Na+-driven multidrug efflux pump
MIVLRLILVLGLAGLAGLVLAWLFTRDKKYLDIAGRIVRFIVVLAVVVALVFVAERVILR